MNETITEYQRGLAIMEEQRAELGRQLESSRGNNDRLTLENMKALQELSLKIDEMKKMQEAISKERENMGEAALEAERQIAELYEYQLGLLEKQRELEQKLKEAQERGNRPSLADQATQTMGMNPSRKRTRDDFLTQQWFNSKRPNTQQQRIRPPSFQTTNLRPRAGLRNIDADRPPKGKKMKSGDDWIPGRTSTRKK